MADNRNKNDNQNQNQNKQQQPMNKPQRPMEKEGGNVQQSGNKGGGNQGVQKSDKDIGNENRKVQKDLDTDETDEGESLDEQGEITQRNPRPGEDIERR